MKKILGVVTLLALGGSGIYWGVTHPATFSRMVTAAHITQTAKAFEYDLKVGQTWTLDLSFHSQGSFAMSLGGGGSVVKPLSAMLLPLVLEINDNAFEASVISKSETGYELFLRTRQVALNIAVPGQTAPLSTDPWNAGVLIELSRDGVLEGLHFPTNQNPVSSSFYRVLAAALFPRGVQGQSVMEIPGGLLTAQQSVDQTADGGVAVTSEFTKFLPQDKAVQAVTEGRATVRYGASTFKGLQLTRKTRQMMSAQTLGEESLNITVTPALVRPITTDSITAAAQLKAQPVTMMGAKKEFEDAEIALARRKVEGTTFEKVKARFEVKAPKNLAEDHEVYDLLKAWLVLKPEAIPEIAALLEEFSPEDPRYDMVGVLLVNTNRPEGQRELTNRIDAQFDNPRRVERLLFSLALAERPTPETSAKALAWVSEQSTEGPGYESALPLAAAIGYRSDPETREKIANAVLTRGLKSEDRALRTQAANALGNLGYEGTLDKVTALLNSPKADERSLGVAALRRVQGDGAEKATAVLTTISATDADANIRRHAATNLNSRTIGDDQAAILEQRLRKETDPSTVVNIAQAISSGVVERQKARDILVRYNLECGHPAVCKKVEGLIQLLSQSP